MMPLYIRRFSYSGSCPVSAWHARRQEVWTALPSRKGKHPSTSSCLALLQRRRRRLLLKHGRHARHGRRLLQNNNRKWLSRLVRLMRSFPEMITMVKGIGVASRAVSTSIFMVAMLVYIFGILINITLRDEVVGTGEAGEFFYDHFANLRYCMWTLLMDGTFLDNTGEVLGNLLLINKWNTLFSAALLFIFILLSAITIMNMLIGILCEVVSTVAQQERDEGDIKIMKRTILQELKLFDGDYDGFMNKTELGRVMESPRALRVLRDLEIDVQCLSELQQMLFPSDDATLSIESIMDLLLTYRGSLPSTVRHVVDGQVFTRWYLSSQLRLRCEQLEASVSSIHTELKAALRPACPLPRPQRQLQVVDDDSFRL